MLLTSASPNGDRFVCRGRGQIDVQVNPASSIDVANSSGNRPTAAITEELNEVDLTNVIEVHSVGPDIIVKLEVAYTVIAGIKIPCHTHVSAAETLGVRL